MVVHLEDAIELEKIIRDHQEIKKGIVVDTNLLISGAYEDHKNHQHLALFIRFLDPGIYTDPSIHRVGLT